MTFFICTERFLLNVLFCMNLFRRLLNICPLDFRVSHKKIMFLIRGSCMHNIVLSLLVPSRIQLKRRQKEQTFDNPDMLTAM